eukprot:352616-Chlamydomonas_euryale.AAC.4
MEALRCPLGLRWGCGGSESHLVEALLRAICAGVLQGAGLCRKLSTSLWSWSAASLPMARPLNPTVMTPSRCERRRPNSTASHRLVGGVSKGPLGVLSGMQRAVASNVLLQLSRSAPTAHAPPAAAALLPPWPSLTAAGLSRTLAL